MYVNIKKLTMSVQRAENTVGCSFKILIFEIIVLESGEFSVDDKELHRVECNVLMMHTLHIALFKPFPHIE